MTVWNLNNIPSDSPAGRERDLADLLDQAVLETLDNVGLTEKDDLTLKFLYQYLMTYEGAFVELTRENDYGLTYNECMSLRTRILQDMAAGRNKGEYFIMRVRQRLEMLQKIMGLGRWASEVTPD